MFLGKYYYKYLGTGKKTGSVATAELVIKLVSSYLVVHSLMQKQTLILNAIILTFHPTKDSKKFLLKKLFTRII